MNDNLQIANVFRISIKYARYLQNMVNYKFVKTVDNNKKNQYNPEI